MVGYTSAFADELDFIREGHFARHIRRMRMLYMERRRALVKAIQIQMVDMTEVIGAEACRMAPTIWRCLARLPRGVSPQCPCPFATRKHRPGAA